MAGARASVSRRLFRWYFKPPAASPWVTYNVSIGADRAAAYLETLRRRFPNLTLNHLLTAALGRALRDYPAANTRLVGRRIIREPVVSVLLPVNLLGHAEGGRRELSLALVSPADRLSLREIAGQVGEAVRGEREGRSRVPLMKPVVAIADSLPDLVFNAILDGLALLLRLPVFVELFHRAYPFTTVLTNLGSAVRPALPEGARVSFYGGSMAIPPRPFHFATFWGVGPLQEEVVPREGLPALRAALPVALLFDHRLLDGVIAGRLLLRFAEILEDPESVFGADGTRVS